MREHPDRNLRPVAEERVANRALPRTDDPDNLSTSGLHVDDVGAVDPRMPGAHALLAAGGHDHEMPNAQCGTLKAQ